jgi:hypothetical protein
MSKIIVTVIAVLVIFPVTVFAQENRSCAERAQLCIKAGGTQANCFDANRMAQCKASGTYVAPNGSQWPAPRK